MQNMGFMAATWMAECISKFWLLGSSPPGGGARRAVPLQEVDNDQKMDMHPDGIDVCR